MQAPHPGVCHRCHATIAAGEPIRSFNRPSTGTWYHLACVGSKAAPSTMLALAHVPALPPSSSNGSGPIAPAGAPLAPTRMLDTLAAALAGHAEPPCPCTWLGVSYDERCAWLLPAVRAARRADDSWRASELAELATLAVTSATPDTARDIECYADGLRHGMTLLGADVSDPATDTPSGQAMPYGAYFPPGAGDGHIAYGSLWDIAGNDAVAPLALTTDSANVAPSCTCTLVDDADGTSILTTCAACVAAATGSAA